MSEQQELDRIEDNAADVNDFGDCGVSLPALRPIVLALLCGVLLLCGPLAVAWVMGR